MLPLAYYNETDAYAADWLRHLVAEGAITPGDVDTRSVVDVRPADLGGYTQHHFFAGIGGWPVALALAGWPEERPVWTGSCPCQPFSAAGKGGGFDDERHLWPDWFWLIGQCRPPVVLGEQVASADGVTWLDLVLADLEGADYAVASVDFPAAGVGAPHIRQRLFFVGNSVDPRLERHAGHGDDRDQPGRQRADADRSVAPPGRTGGFWAATEWLSFGDGKRRAVEPGTLPLAHGVPARVGRLRAYGNAVVPQAAAAFVQAYLEAERVA